MKSTILIIMIILCVQSGVALSKDSGLLIGLNSHTWKGKDAEMMGEAFSYAFSSKYSQKSSAGISLGAFYEIYSNRFFSIEPELHWIMKGSRFKGNIEYDNQSYDTQISFNINYLEIPFLIKLPVTTKPQKAHFRVLAGPFFGFNIGSKLVVKVDEEQEEEDIDDFQSRNHGFILGGGIVFPSGMFFDLRYQRDLSPTMEDMDIFNQAIAVYWGMTY